ncbi:GPR1/FUN34/yaaH [Penicillium expansum]|nr:GPR1/FUN34/yaaH [Penicillium expansum]
MCKSTLSGNSAQPLEVTYNLSKSFANPTPISVLGLAISVSTLGCDLMGWRGAGGNGAASTGAYFFMGGLLMMLGGFLEFISGNTFPFILFCGYGGWWLSYGATLQPFFGAYGAYSPDASDPSKGLEVAGFNATFVELSLTISFALLSGAFWELALGNASVASNLQTAGGAFLFVAGIAAWYILLAITLSSVGFPFTFPLGDLGGFLTKKERLDSDASA